MLPDKIEKFPATLIVNTDPSSEPSEHWVVIHFDSKDNGEYFDSYGLPPLHQEIKLFMNKICFMYGYNPVVLQCFECITCGQYCVLYVKYKYQGFKYCDFISLFSNNQEKNNLIVKALVPVD